MSAASAHSRSTASASHLKLARDCAPCGRGVAPLVGADVAPLLDADVAPLLDVDVAPLLDADVAPLVDADVAPLVGAVLRPLWAQIQPIHQSMRGVCGQRRRLCGFQAGCFCGVRGM